METAQKSHKVVYTIVERTRDGKKFWLRIGAAFENRDGSLNVHLDAVPTNGTLQIREYVPWEESRDKAGHREDEVVDERELMVG